jgi:VanZ like protein
VIVARAQQTKFGRATTVGALLFIAALTLRPLGGPLPSGFHTCIICGTYGAADFVLNVLLFVPLGFGLRLSGMRRWVAWTCCFALCGWIELMQDFVITGRDSGVNDLVANPLGAAIGILVADQFATLVTPGPRTARRLVAVAVAAWLALATFVQWALRPSIPDGIYYGQIARLLSHYDIFHGPVEGMVEGVPVPDHRLSDSATRAIQHALRSRAHIAISATPTTADSGAGSASLLRIADGVGREVAVVYCERREMVFRVRVRAEDLRMHPVSRFLPNAIRCDGSARGDTVHLAADVSQGTIVLSAESGGVTTARRAEPGVWLGWHFFVSDDRSIIARHPVLATALWVAGWLVPLGFWLARAHWPAPASGGLSAAVIVTGLALIPATAGAGPAPPPVWLAAGAGIIVGWCLAWISPAF